MICWYFQRGRTILDTCAYISISAYHWYPTQINGHMFTGKNSDSFQLPESLLEVPALPAGTLSPSACRRVQLTEYSTEHWFLTNDKTTALNDKASRPTHTQCQIMAAISTSRLIGNYTGDGMPPLAIFPKVIVVKV